MQRIIAAVIIIVSLGAAALAGRSLAPPADEAALEPRKDLIVDKIPYAPEWERPDLWAKAIAAGEPEYLAERAAAEGDFRFILTSNDVFPNDLGGILCHLPIVWTDQFVKLSPAPNTTNEFFSWPRVPLDFEELQTGSGSLFARDYNASLAAHPLFPYTDICETISDENAEGLWYISPGYTRGSIVRLAEPEALPEIESGDLATAARLGDLEAVRTSLQRNDDPDQVDSWGMTALGWAAIRGHTEIVSALLAQGASPRKSSGAGGRSPLTWAAFGGKLSIVQSLLDAGVAPQSDQADTAYETPLAAAARMGHDTIIEILIANGADPNYVPTAYQGFTTRIGPSPLVEAAQSDQAETVKLLVELGADPNFLVPNVRNVSSALGVAVRKLDTGLIRWLIGNGADVNLTGYDGKHLALEHAARSLEITELLLDLGADPNAGADKRARQYERRVWAPIGRAVIAGSDDVALALLEAGADLNEPQYKGVSLLLDGARRLDLDTLRKFADAGAQAYWGLGGPRTSRWTFCHLEKKEFKPTLKLLVSAGLDLTETDERGESVLFSGCFEPPQIQALVDAGADANHRDPDGRTALFNARFRRKDDVVATLLEAGADPTIRDRFGRLYTDYDQRRLTTPEQVAKDKIQTRARKE